MKSKEDVTAGGEYDIPTEKTSELAVLQLRSVQHRRRSNSVGPVMTPDKRTRHQLSPSPIPKLKKYASDSKPAHIIPNTPNRLHKCGVETRLLHPTAAWKKD
ncbi:hypothetical protein EVAR_89429_1 [Eumeta japonica]|uniref:Uncharacterized protein n=1 Tax=Eumeta variegata TaxID=151549 RepID=A0A4C1Z3F6_EUMVA|nr:hypothetical protein EVAR_89429_1 [Eumeta japonica]